MSDDNPNRVNRRHIIREALSNSENINNGATININFNKYTNCYNTYNKNYESSDDDSIEAEIEITESPLNATQSSNGIRTTTRSAIVPIPLNSSQEDISSRIQNVVNTIINDTDDSTIHTIPISNLSAELMGNPLQVTQNINTGLSLTTINNNTEVFINNDTSQKCHICNEFYKENDICRKVLKCGHYFHQACIDTWFSENNKCPICNQVVG